ncbi:MAG: hypothetical protein WAM60_03040 [Candidatus Promineifilaceae bacterium]
MCGIFGIVSKTAVNPQQFRLMAEANKQRGNLAFGVLTAENGRENSPVTVSRYPDPFRPEMVQFGDVRVALGHIRAPTAGQTRNTAELHPFSADNLYLAHNGLLLNYTAFPQWRLNSAVAVDSQVILGGIYANREQGITAAIEMTVAQLEGQQACWLWSAEEAALYLWRIMSPIYALTNDDQFLFSSIKIAPEMTLLSEGIVYRLENGRTELEEVGKFAFDSPYLIGSG